MAAKTRTWNEMRRALTQVVVMCEYLKKQGALREPKYDEACPYEPTTEGMILMRAKLALAAEERLPSDPPDGQEISAGVSTVGEVGYCNACTSQCIEGAERRRKQRITEVRLRGLTFRLCDACKDELGRQLFHS